MSLQVHNRMMATKRKLRFFRLLGGEIGRDMRDNWEKITVEASTTWHTVSISLMMVDFLFRAYRLHPLEMYLLQTEAETLGHQNGWFRKSARKNPWVAMVQTFVMP